MISRLLQLLLAVGFAGQAVGQTLVSTAPLSGVAVYPERFAPATVISLNEPLLSARITANVLDVPVRVGDFLSKNDPVVRLDCTEYELFLRASQASVDSAEARSTLAQSQLERAQSLVKDNLVSIQELDLRRTELDAVAAELKASKANRDIAELNRSRCLIAAPFDALVLDRTVSVGQLVTPGTAVVKLLDLESIEIRAEIFSADAEFLDNESSLEFSDGTQRYPVRLGTLVAAINGVNRNREARLQFIGEAPLPGTSGKLHWLDPRPHLPPGYLVQRDQQLGYFVARDGKAEFVFLESAQPGRSNPVIADLDEQIVIEGFAGLQTGDSISVEPE